MEQRKLQVEYLPDIHLEETAYNLIGDYNRQYSIGRDDPIPVDTMIEVHFGLLFEIDDLRQYFGSSDVLGATWIKEETVRIDESLDPTNTPYLEGRYNYTVAHEIGHWVLHRPLLIREENQGSLFDSEGPEAIVCRSSQKKEPMEVQADLFASYLLMPEDRVRETWRDMFGSGTPRITFNMNKGAQHIGSIMHPISDNAKMMAKRFKVSSQAMQIRLEKLGFIKPTGLLAKFI